MKAGFGSSLAAIGAAIAYSGPASAQVSAEDPTSANDEIIVTAQKRATDLQKTPLAMSAIGGEDLAKRQITDLESLSTTSPNVNLGKNVGFARIPVMGTYEPPRTFGASIAFKY